MLRLKEQLREMDEKLEERTMVRRTYMLHRDRCSGLILTTGMYVCTYVSAAGLKLGVSK